jgi:hypothetical protein
VSRGSLHDPLRQFHWLGVVARIERSDMRGGGDRVQSSGMPPDFASLNLGQDTSHFLH